MTEAQASLTAEDHIAIQRVLALYNQTFDQGDPDAFLELLADGAVVESGQWTRGAAELREMIIESRSRPPHRHFTTNSVVAPVAGSASEATATSCWIYTITTPEGVVVRSTGTYTDEFVKVDDEWRLRKRVIQSEGRPS